MTAVAAAATRSRVLRAHTFLAPAELDAQQGAARAELLVEQRLAQAFEQGRSAGLEEAGTLEQQTAERLCSTLDRVVADTAALHEQEVRATSTAVVELAQVVAEWVLRRELSIEGDGLLVRLEEALGALLPSPTTRLSVSPKDLAVVTLWADSRGRVGTEVVADARLDSGDVVVVTDAGRAELTVRAALDAAGEALGLLTDPTFGNRPGSSS